MLSGYGPNQVFACLIEPLVLACSHRREPYSIGRALDPSDVVEFGAAAQQLGFAPRLAKGWSAVDSNQLILP